jgi:nicotinate-nucleotide adenylyltransferase
LLRLYIYVKDHHLQVRKASAHERFISPCIWRNQVEFEYCVDENYMLTWVTLLPDLDPVEARALLDLVGARYPISPQYQKLKKLCPKIVYQNMADEWVFYGGSFNPWHSGHQACVDLLPLDLTCFVLPDINPQKQQYQFELVSSVIELSAKARFTKNQFLVPSFLIEPVKNPTVIWMERLKKEFPEKKLSLLLGFDSFSQISHWIRGRELLPLLHCLYVVSRMETDHAREKISSELKTIAPNLEIEFLGRHGYEEVSSTDIRTKKGKH